ncbi:MAG: hypothetical protein ABI629_06000 [bacterium]
MTSAIRRGFGQQAAQRVGDRHVAEEGRGAGRRPGRIAVANRNRVHARAGDDRRLEHRRVKGQQPATVADRRFGKRRHRLPVAQRLSQSANRARRAAHRAALDE